MTDPARHRSGRRLLADAFLSAHDHERGLAYEGLDGGSELGPELVSGDTSIAQLVSAGDALHPAEDLFDQLAALLADREQLGPMRSPVALAVAMDAEGGRVMITSMSLLTLEVYYRYLPLYRQDMGETKQ